MTQTKPLPTAWVNGWEWPVTFAWKATYSDGSVGYWPGGHPWVTRHLIKDYREDVDVSIVSWGDQ